MGALGNLAKVIKQAFGAIVPEDKKAEFAQINTGFDELIKEDEKPVDPAKPDPAKPDPAKPDPAKPDAENSQMMKIIEEQNAKIAKMEADAANRAKSESEKSADAWVAKQIENKKIPADNDADKKIWKEMYIASPEAANSAMAKIPGANAQGSQNEPGTQPKPAPGADAKTTFESSLAAARNNLAVTLGKN